METQAQLGIIGGSGLYAMEGLENVSEHKISTPFGEPSSPIVIGTLGSLQVAFLARHGIGHFINPSEVNYRANIYALKSLGVKWVVAVSACGSLREDYAPGDIVVPDQLFDLTKDRKRSFFEGGLVAHISVAEPFCTDLCGLVQDAVAATEATVHDGGTYITVEGPRFSTRGESNVYRTWGMSIIGMTTSPEAFLAREAEMCYSVMAHVTDYDVWHVSEEPVTVEIVMRTVQQNTVVAKQAIQNLVNQLTPEVECQHQNALAEALTTDASNVPPETLQKLTLFTDKYWGA
ncbi:MAG: S-methyl-5'-thioadenosine phosphorylase [Chloroflexi bacterium]|nr:MAG: S-methyl-5'-thioadenosine phosphorylase [Chloroflexota bacterium]MBL1193397.1 S-methyl-5'-thioadenosine phosphorylase [Chloroflexota bacterium]NOH10689.1 S-methyl-5'-thioadenosine phosphorylase [Chloroflexota bacterium]